MGKFKIWSVLSVLLSTALATPGVCMLGDGEEGSHVLPRIQTSAPHRPSDTAATAEEEFVLHRPQEEIFRRDFSGKKIIGYSRIKAEGLQEDEQDLYAIVQALESYLIESLKPTAKGIIRTEYQPYVGRLTAKRELTTRSLWNEAQHRLLLSSADCSPIYRELKPVRCIEEKVEGSLREVSFKNCYLTTKNLSALVEVLKNFSQLHYVDLENNDLDDKACHAIVQLARMPSVSFINVRNNKFSSSTSAIEKLREAATEGALKRQEILEKVILFAAAQMADIRSKYFPAKWREQHHRFDIKSRESLGRHDEP